MSNTVQTILHLLSIAALLASLLTGLVPPKYAPVVLVVQGAISSLIKQIASTYNPDGTPAQVPYTPPK